MWSMRRLNKMAAPKKGIAGQPWHADADSSESNPLHAHSSGCLNVDSSDIPFARKWDSPFFGDATRHRRDATPCIDDKVDRCKTGLAGLDKEFELRLNHAHR